MQTNLEMLKEEMAKRNCNITKLSELSNIDKSTISRFLSGNQTCTVETAQNISEALHLSSTKAGLIFFGKEVADTQQ